MGTPSRRPGSERRTQIADAALAIIGREGFAALTTATLAREVGLTSGALFRHFPSREAILEEMVRLAVERLDATIPDAGLSPIERLRHMTRARVRLLSREPGLAWLLRSEEAFLALPSDAIQQMKRLIQRSRSFLGTALRQAVKEGSVRDDLPPEMLLFLLTSTVHALVQAPGVHGRAGRRMGVDRVLDGLFTLLAPPRSR